MKVMKVMKVMNVDAKCKWVYISEGNNNIYNIIIYILYLRIRFKSRQNAYNLKPPSPLLRSS